MPARRLYLDSILIFLAGLLLMSACSVSSTVKDTTRTITKTTKKIAREITFADDGLKKMIAVVGFENKSLQERDDFQTGFHKDLIEFLNTQCDDIIVLDTESDAQAGRVTQLPKLDSGQTDNYAMAIIGRQLGVNAIVAGSLNSIRPLDEERGILWAKATHYLIEVMIRAEVYDTQTATKILDESFPRKSEIDETEYRLIQEQNAYNVPQINEAFHQVATEMGDRICETVSEQHWHGYVTAVDGEKITISIGGPVGLEPGDVLEVSIGGPVGLEPGDVLEVFDSGRLLEGVDDQRFLIPGFKTAEIKIVSVSDRQAKAVKVSGRGLKPGSIVRKK
jgi:hypothetical protein